MANVAILLEDDFEDSEFDTPRTTLLESEHQVTVIGREAGKELHGKKGRVTYTADVGIDEVSADDFDLLVVPGGYSPDKLRTDPRVVGFVRTMHDQGKPVAAICHAGSLLIEANVVRGVTLTSWPSIKTDLINAGATWVDEEVVEHGQFITSRRPDDLPAFARAILDRLGTLAPEEAAAAQ
jgi:protease I